MPQARSAMAAAVLGSVGCAAALWRLESSDVRATAVVALIWLLVAPLGLARDARQAVSVSWCCSTPFFGVALAIDRSVGEAWGALLTLAVLGAAWSAMVAATAAMGGERAARALWLWAVVALAGPLALASSNLSGRSSWLAEQLSACSAAWWLIERSDAGQAWLGSAWLVSASVPTAFAALALWLAGRSAPVVANAS